MPTRAPKRPKKPARPKAKAAPPAKRTKVKKPAARAAAKRAQAKPAPPKAKRSKTQAAKAKKPVARKVAVRPAPAAKRIVKPIAKPVAKASARRPVAAKARAPCGPLPVHRIEVGLRPGQLDPAGREALGELHAAGATDVTEVHVVRTYFVEGRLSEKDLHRGAREVLADPVMDRFAVAASLPSVGKGARPVTVTRRAGVTDPEAESAASTLRSLGLEVGRVKTARTYWILGGTPGRAGDASLLAAAGKALGNEVIEEVSSGTLATYRFPAPAAAPVVRRNVPIRDLTPEGLAELSARLHLSLSVVEMTAIRERFRQEGREPSDLELETIAQTWSEHCKHKTLTGPVDYEDLDGRRRIDHLLRDTIFHATAAIDAPWCLSVFKDNAGVVVFDDEDAVCMKVETHNHPSAIEPYGGAGTGIGGVIRDVLGTGLGARPVASTDVFCFGPPDLPVEEVPAGCLHPRRLMKGVVAGVRDYGNRMGIPTVNGAILFEPRYVGNPVVFCGCVGMLPRRFVGKAAKKGDLVVAFGGRTGRDGIHGATFSSAELTSKSESVSSGAVQIGDAITEKKVLDVLLAARDEGLFTCVTDCGAGGFSSAVGEMGADLGVEVDLSAAPLKYAGLRYDEVWISEAQERMVASLAPKDWPRFQELCESEDVEAVVLGHFTGDGRLVVKHGDVLVGDLSMEFLHDGLPKVVRRATFRRGGGPEREGDDAKDATATLIALLATPDVGSKEWVVRQYDHEVQAGAVVRAWTGVGEGPSDAAVLAPKLGSTRGIVLSNGINPRYGDVDPYAMAWAVVDEALRNAIAVGAALERVAILDNFTWGRTDHPDRLGTLVRAAEGCRDAALHFGTPFISGKDSLNNEFRMEDGTLIVVPPTLLISAIGVIEDVRATTTSDLKAVGDVLLLVGETHDECGGSAWYRLEDRLGSRVPVVRETAKRTLLAIQAAIAAGHVRAAHDLSEGGLAVAAAEMAIAGDLGLELELAKVPASTRRDDRLLFSESTTRLLLEVPADRAEAVVKEFALANVAAAAIGVVTREPRLRIRSASAPRDVVSADVRALGDAWRHALPMAREEGTP